MSVFETIKAAVTLRQAAEHYGLRVLPNGMTCCPFHKDRHPSLKLNEEYFYCFGCGAAGDVVDFTARLFGLSCYEAAQKLASDFGISPEPEQQVTGTSKSKPPQWHQSQLDEIRCRRVLTDYLHLTVTQFKVQAEQERLETVTGLVAQAEQNLADTKAAAEKQKKKLEVLQKETKAAKAAALTVQDIEAMGKKNALTGNVSFTPQECDTLKKYAVNCSPLGRRCLENVLSYWMPC